MSSASSTRAPPSPSCRPAIAVFSLLVRILTSAPERQVSSNAHGLRHLVCRPIDKQVDNALVILRCVGGVRKLEDGLPLRRGFLPTRSPPNGRGQPGAPRPLFRIATIRTRSCGLNL